MWRRLIIGLKAPVFPGDEEQTRRARALNAIHLNMGSALVVLGTFGILFVFAEKIVTSILLLIGVLITIGGMILNRRGYVKSGGVILLATLWAMTMVMSSLSGGVRSLDIIFFISGTVIAGIVLGAKGAYSYAGLSLLSGLGLVLIGNAGFEFPQIFMFPPAGAWIILLINLVFTVVPLQVAVQSLSDSASRARISEERYRLIASVMSDYAFSIEYGLNGEVADQWLSGAFEEITGYAPEEYFARGGWSSILHPDDKKQDERDMAQLSANQKVVTEVRIIQKNGNIRWVLSYGHPIWDDKNNRLAGIYGAVQDITDRKGIEISLRQRADEMALLYQITLALTSEADLYHALRVLVKELKRVMTVDAFHIGLYDEQTDLFTYSLFLNLGEDLQIPPRKLQEKPGLTWEVISKGQILYLQDITDPATKLKHNIVIVIDAGIRSYIGIPLMLHERVIGIMSVQACQVAAYTADQIRLLEMLAGQVAITIEKLNLLEQLHQELNERKLLIAELELRNAESETLRESTAIVAATLERSEAITLILEQLARVVHYDSASVQLLVGDMLEIVSSSGLDVNTNIGMQFKLNESEPAYPVLQGHVPYLLYEDIQISIPTFNDIPHNGIHAWMAIPLKAKGQVVGIIALDGQRPGQFTERDAMLAVTYANQVAVALENARLFSELQDKFAERQKLIAELENKNAELERFTYTVSHDLRSPLVTIKGFLGYLERSASAGNMESFHKDMARISNATDRMDHLLKDVLELSRIGRLVNAPVDVPFGDLVKEAVEIVHGRLDARGITLHTQPDLPLVHGDKPRLIEVLQNLIDNAAKYMGAQSKPLIEIGSTGFDSQGNQIFFVRDNGMGIAPEYYERIFGLFDKLDASSDGTGIGLALVKRIIEFHGGRIWVEAAVGQGTTFYFTLQG